MKNIDVSEVTEAWKEQQGFDPNGSYTGTPDRGEAPTQDADDL